MAACFFAVRIDVVVSRATRRQSTPRAHFIQIMIGELTIRIAVTFPPQQRPR
jgi:hypothetical protein